MDLHYPPGPGSASLRRGRWSEAGGIYFVTFTTQGRARLFEDWTRAWVACSAITDRRVWRHADLLAWVLMPDHWHGLVQLGKERRLSDVVRRLKTNTARQVRLASPGIERVWAKGYHEHALRAEESMEGVARYIVLNPRRAGLVERVGDYPFWDAVWI